MVGAQGAQQNIAHARIAQNYVESIAPLRHGALPQYLASGKRLCAYAFHIFTGLAQQQNFAVHAGVQHLAKAVLRPLAQHFCKLRAYILTRDVEPIFFAPTGRQGLTAKKRRIKMEAAHGKPLTFKQFSRQQAVQPARKQYNNLWRIAHARACTTAIAAAQVWQTGICCSYLLDFALIDNYTYLMQASPAAP